VFIFPAFYSNDLIALQLILPSVSTCLMLATNHQNTSEDALAIAYIFFPGWVSCLPTRLSPWSNGLPVSRSFILSLPSSGDPAFESLSTPFFHPRRSLVFTSSYGHFGLCSQAQAQFFLQLVCGYCFGCVSTLVAYFDLLNVPFVVG
jgi:hypothetical protein